MYCKALYKRLKQIIPENLFEEFEHFDKNYFLERTLCGNGKYSLVDLGNQTCRFCQKQYPEVNFNKDAHVISAMMSNAKVLSNFECDVCNEMFGIYEKDFGEYSSIMRTIDGLPNRKGKIPKFQRNSGVKFENITDQNIFSKIGINPKNKRLILYAPFGNDKALEHPSGKENFMKNRIKRKPYRPINVFRVFLKIGLSIIKKEELKNYEINRKFLINNSLNITKEEEYKDEKISINIRKSRIFNPIPIVYLFSKKENGIEWYADKTITLLWGHTMFQIPIFSDKNLKYGKNFYTLGYAIHPITLNPHTYDLIFNEEYYSVLDNSSRELVNFYCSRLVEDDSVTMVLSSKGPTIRTDMSFNRI